MIRIRLAAEKLYLPILFFLSKLARLDDCFEREKFDGNPGKNNKMSTDIRICKKAI